MDNNSKAGFEKIGDKQYHHFKVIVPNNTGKLSLSLDGDAGYDFALYTLSDSFAFQSKAVKVSAAAGAKQERKQNQAEPVNRMSKQD